MISRDSLPQISALFADLMSGKNAVAFCADLVKALEIASPFKQSGYKPIRRACVYLDRPPLGGQLIAGTKPGQRDALTRTFVLPISGKDSDGAFSANLRLIVIGQLEDEEADILTQVASACEAEAARAGQSAAQPAHCGDNRAAAEAAGQPAEESAWGMAAASESSRLLFNQVQQVGPTTLTVLITGETGTGKEMIARALHTEARKAGRTGEFVAVNCGNMTETLLESTLFGHTRGAFTGATCDRKGFFEIAENGTIFLDEIGEMPMAQQVALLRVLQEKKIRRVGSTQEKAVNVRVIAATHKDLKEMVEAGQFRQDLYYRLNVLKLNIQPLRERPEDIPAIVEYQLKKLSAERGVELSLSEEAMAVLLEHAWPGNVRELVNCLEGASIAHQDGVIHEQHLSLEHGLRRVARINTVDEGLPKPDVFVLPQGLTYDEMMKTFEIFFLERTLVNHQGNKSSVARSLGKSRRTVSRRIDDLGIRCDDFRLPYAGDLALVETPLESVA